MNFFWKFSDGRWKIPSKFEVSCSWDELTVWWTVKPCLILPPKMSHFLLHHNFSFNFILWYRNTQQLLVRPTAELHNLLLVSCPNSSAVLMLKFLLALCRNWIPYFGCFSLDMNSWKSLFFRVQVQCSASGNPVTVYCYRCTVISLNLIESLISLRACLN